MLREASPRQSQRKTATHKFFHTSSHIFSVEKIENREVCERQKPLGLPSSGLFANRKLPLSAYAIVPQTKENPTLEKEWGLEVIA